MKCLGPAVAKATENFDLGLRLGFTLPFSVCFLKPSLALVTPCVRTMIVGFYCCVGSDALTFPQTVKYMRANECCLLGAVNVADGCFAVRHDWFLPQSITETAPLRRVGHDAAGTGVGRHTLDSAKFA